MRAAMATMATVPGFAWPVFDHWQAFFAAAGIFPAAWEGLQVAPAPDTPAAQEYEQRKLLLFSEWVDMLARRPAVLAHYTRQGIRARIVRQHAGLPCLACDPFNMREVSPGSDAIPPFHPGCRCVLLAAHTPRPRRRSKPYERPRARTG
jgi:hypothetical protein